MEALKFGAPGGALLGFVLALVGGGLVPSIFVTLIGALVGLLVAYPALIVGSIAADSFSRWAGALAAFILTLVAIGAVMYGGDWRSPWVALPIGVAAYAAVVTWFRIPRILAR